MADLQALTVLTLSEINQLVEDAGSSIVLDDAKFNQLNASNEAQYEVTYFSAAADKNVTDHVFISYDSNGGIRLQINDFVTAPEDLNPSV